MTGRCGDGTIREHLESLTGVPSLDVLNVRSVSEVRRRVVAMTKRTTSARTKTDNEPRFTFGDLLAELKTDDDYRRISAMTLAYHAKLLVDLRAAANGSLFEDEWKTIFDRKKLLAEIDSDDPRRRRAALSVLDDVSHVDTLRYPGDRREAPTVGERVWRMELHARINHRVDQLRAANGVRLDRSTKN